MVIKNKKGGGVLKLHSSFLWLNHQWERNKSTLGSVTLLISKYHSWLPCFTINIIQKLLCLDHTIPLQLNFPRMLIPKELTSILVSTLLEPSFNSLCENSRPCEMPLRVTECVDSSCYRTWWWEQLCHGGRGVHRPEHSEFAATSRSFVACLLHWNWWVVLPTRQAALGEVGTSTALIPPPYQQPHCTRYRGAAYRQARSGITPFHKPMHQCHNHWATLRPPHIATKSLYSNPATSGL